MEAKEVLDELKSLLITRLKFEPARLAAVDLSTPLPKGVEGSVGLDSLDFIELAIAVEERYGIAIDDQQDATEHFTSFATLAQFILARAGPG
jgi:acyl carrier protein